MKFLILIVLCATTYVAGNVVNMGSSRLPLLARFHRGPQGRITKGNEAVPKQFPYQVALDLFANVGRYSCGGSILSNRWVLTAAHCAELVTKGVDVHIGAWNRTDINEKGHEKIHVSTDKVFLHEKWNTETLANDIALIKFPVEIEFNEFVKPIKLPKKSSNYATYEGMPANITGWGKISDSGPGAETLQWLEVPIMRNSGCSPWYAGTITESQICIKTTGGKSTCNGDSGGPLAVMEDGSPTLVGATSFGIAFGCESGWPGVFTRITSYLDWIDEKMQNN